MPEQTQIRCLIVDDEPPAREVIRRYIDQLPMLTLVGEAPNAIAAMRLLQQQPIDLVFLDVRMPQLNGNELMKVVRNPPPVIFTTAHPEYAVEGFDLDAVDYLLKPVRFDRFVKAVNKVVQLKDYHVAEAADVEDDKKESFVYFRVDRKMVKVMLSDILYVESMKDYVKVYTTAEMLITKQSITSVEAMLPENSFARIHRSFIVSLSKVKSYTSETIEIEKAEIPIGKLYRPGIVKLLAG